MIVNLQDAANASGLVFAQIQPGQPTPAVDQTGKQLGYTAIPITVIVRGEWADHIDFVRRLDKLTRGVRVVSCSYTYRQGTETEPSTIEGVLNLEVYTMSVVQVTPNAVTPSVPTSPPAGATSAD